MINQITIIGLGIVGRSIASAIRQSDFTKRIVGYDSNPTNVTACRSQELVDDCPIQIESAVKSADIIAIAVPYAEYEQILNQIAPHLKAHAAITDIATIKQPIMQLAKKILGEHYSNFVPSHPIINLNEANDLMEPALFAGRPIIVTPSEETDERAVETIRLFWEAMGGEIEIMPAAENDALLASTCHLPQLLAFTFINSVKNKESIQRYITKNFKDFTSIATHSPILWRDLCIANREAILKEIGDFEVNLQKMKQILEAEETDTLLEHFSDAKQMRENM